MTLLWVLVLLQWLVHLGRNFIGFELCQEYVDIANKRLCQETLVSSGLF